MTTAAGVPTIAPDELNWTTRVFWTPETISLPAATMPPPFSDATPKKVPPETLAVHGNSVAHMGAPVDENSTTTGATPPQVMVSVSDPAATTKLLDSTVT